ncbi:MAG TPA: TonB-dependent receptor, partial [Albitalea sp.]|nr:TonB-dependent receptor [Albitalea sp.]
AEASSGTDRRTSGGNLLLRFGRDIDAHSGVQVQAYLDRTRRDEPGLFAEKLDTLDIDIQHRYTAIARHEIVWGGGLRQQRDRTAGSALLAFVPADSKLTLWNLFGQDTLSLGERTKLTLGLKAERNDYTGTEYQPNIRWAWKRSEQSLVWAAVSRAVRIPSRLDRDFQVFVNLPPPYNAPLFGGPGFKAERLTAYEIGYRAQPDARLSYSVSTFVNDYDRLRSVEPSGSGFALSNGVRARTYGVESWAALQVDPAWRVSAGLTLLHERFDFAAASRDPGLPGAGANDPRHQFQLRSSWNLPHRVNVDFALRQVGALPRPAVPGYTAVDARLGWAISPRTELAVAGFNLFDAQHPEFGAAPLRSEVPRSLVVSLSWEL